MSAKTIKNSLLRPFTCLIVPAMLLSACATQNANSNNNSGYYGVPVMYRTLPEAISDEAIERTSHKNLTNVHGVSENSVRIGIDSFRREVLLTGEVPSEQVKTDVANMISSIHDVKKVYNYLTVTATPKAQSHTLHENYLKSKIIAKILGTGGVHPSQYKLVVRDNMAYLLGFLTAQQEQTIINTIASVQGMEGVRVLTTRIDGDVSQLSLTENAVVSENNSHAEGMMYGGNIEDNTVNNTENTVYPSTPSSSTATTSYPYSMYPNAQDLQTSYPSQSSMPKPKPTTQTPTGIHHPNAPVIFMDGNPTSSYVNLYNNTSSP
ncbi:BON domain-containing protein [Moraxella nonliquefaciens]|uniref:BON domain-containing protein n=1 Tax=Moraxella nonliquefaciens TaxID=478 RepID=UPI001EF7430C|nr:BON domain-containing protein [Moraxella nonliquefaciens]MCG7411118.1 BON domain-containing protein [Moraxella nonliquefaciens]